MITPGSPAVRRRQLAAELRAIRESTGKSGDRVAAALRWSPSKISRLELARTGLKLRDVELLLDYYKVAGPQRALLLKLADDAAGKGWWEEHAGTLSADYRQFIAYEHEASLILIWHVEAVPGLLQTESYARHIISGYNQVEPTAPGLIERLVRVRMRRQQVLDREPAPELSVVLDESVLSRRVGDDVVMRGQLEHLARESRRPNVSLRVLRLDSEHAIFGESFVVFRFGEDGENDHLHDVVCAEHLRNDFTVEGEQATYLHRIAFGRLAGSALDPAASRTLILETARSRWATLTRGDSRGERGTLPRGNIPAVPVSGLTGFPGR